MASSKKPKKRTKKYTPPHKVQRLQSADLDDVIVAFFALFLFPSVVQKFGINSGVLLTREQLSILKNSTETFTADDDDYLNETLGMLLDELKRGEISHRDYSVMFCTMSVISDTAKAIVNKASGNTSSDLLIRFSLLAQVLKERIHVIHDSINDRFDKHGVLRASGDDIRNFELLMNYMMVVFQHIRYCDYFTVWEGSLVQLQNRRRQSVYQACKQQANPNL